MNRGELFRGNNGLSLLLGLVERTTILLIKSMGLLLHTNKAGIADSQNNSCRPCI
jgi:hypothetical protein